MSQAIQLFFQSTIINSIKVGIEVFDHEYILFTNLNQIMRLQNDFVRPFWMFQVTGKNPPFAYPILEKNVLNKIMIGLKGVTELLQQISSYSWQVDSEF